MNTKALRQKVLDLAIHGKLVPQNPNDESATVLLEKIRAEKAEKIKKGELKADKKDSFIFVGSDKRHYEQFADGTVKDIEDEIPFKIPEGWAWCRLGEIVDVLDSQRKPITKSDRKSGIYPYYGATCIQDHVADYLFDEDLLLLGEDGAKWGAGDISAFCISGKTWVNNHAHVLRTKNNINRYYLCNVLIILDLTPYITGTTVPKLNQEKMSQIIIPIPPISEQNKIVSFINKIFAQIDLLDNNKLRIEEDIKKAKSKILDLAIHGKLVPQDPSDEPAEELLKRIATSDNRPYEKVDEEPFELPDSWKWIKLSSICNKLVDGDHNPPKGIEEKTEYIMASSRNINYDRLDDLENVRYLTKEVFEIENNRTEAEKGDIFFTSVGTLGRSCIYSGDYNICFQRSVTVLNTNINNQFLKYFFDSNFFQTYIIEHSTGTAQMGFYLKEMANSPIAIPPLNEQSRIVDKVSELFFQLDQIQNNLV